MKGRDVGPQGHHGRKGRTKASEAVLTCNEPLMRSPMEEAGAMNEITHKPSSSQSSYCVNNAQWNDNPGVECHAHFVGV